MSTTLVSVFPRAASSDPCHASNSWKVADLSHFLHRLEPSGRGLLPAWAVGQRNQATTSSFCLWDSALGPRVTPIPLQLSPKRQAASVSLLSHPLASCPVIFSFSSFAGSHMPPSTLPLFCLPVLNILPHLDNSSRCLSLVCPCPHTYTLSSRPWCSESLLPSHTPHLGRPSCHWYPILKSLIPLLPHLMVLVFIHPTLPLGSTWRGQAGGSGSQPGNLMEHCP